MKAVICMMILSIIYFAVLNIVNKRVDEISFTSNGVGITQDANDKSYYNATIVGAINNPGTYTVSRDSNLGYLITLAGGLKEDADQGTFDLQTKVSDGMSYYIGYKSSNEKVSINKANMALLDTLPGVGSVIASRIITYRTKNGEFKYLEELKNVSGIGDSLFNQIKEYICL